MSTPTPGPWSVQIKTGYAYVVAKGASGGVASVHHIRDAASIAAVPDLVAALKRAIDAGIGSDGRRPSAADQALAALAKAEAA